MKEHFPDWGSDFHNSVYALQQAPRHCRFLFSIATMNPRGSCNVDVLSEVGWLAGVAFLPVAISELRGADAWPIVHGATDFRHTDWKGLGAVFDIKQSSEGYLWLTIQEVYGDRGSVWTGNSSLPLMHIAADGSVTTFADTRQVLSVRRDHNGTIWSSGAGDARLWRSTRQGFSPIHYPGENLDAVVFIAADRNNDPWITTVSGRAYRFSNGAWSHAFSFRDGERGVSENTMAVRGDHVWLAGAGGVQLFTQGQFYLMRWKDRNQPGRVC